MKVVKVKTIAKVKALFEEGFYPAKQTGSKVIFKAPWGQKRMSKEDCSFEDMDDLYYRWSEKKHPFDF